VAEPITIEIAPGLYDIGTDYEAMGRWISGDRVRFEGGSPRPIGGWERRLNASATPIPPLFGATPTETARNAILWQDADGDQHLVVGSDQSLVYVSVAGVVTDITPASFTPAPPPPTASSGYGALTYSLQTYGTPRNGAGFPIKPLSVQSWSFSLWGDTLMAQFRNTERIFKFQPGAGDVIATPLATAPTGNASILVTDQRMLMALDATNRRVLWCDAEDYTDWVPAIDNTAGSYTISGDGILTELVKVGQDILLLTTVDAFVGRFLKAPYIYGFDKVGQNVGIAAPNSVVVSGHHAFWVGANGTFYRYQQGGSVEVMPCDIFDRVRASLDVTAIGRVYGYENPRFREVVWLVQTINSPTGDVNAYVAFSIDTGQWTFGRLRRTTAVPGAANRSPIMVDKAGILWNHEQDGVKAVDAAEPSLLPELTSGPLQIGNGGRRMGISYVWPDADIAGSSGVSVTFEAKEMPDDLTPRTYGPYLFGTSDQPISTTGLQGRQLSMKVTFDAARSKLGRLRVTPAQVGGR
jgi:hypothetical protein